MRTVTLKSGCAKPLWKGHPWVFADSVARVDADASDWVRVVDAEGKLIGQGFYSAESKIRVRLLEHGEAAHDPDALLAQRIDAAVALRKRLFPDVTVTNAYRLIYAEGDALPGLVVDRFADVLVAQFATAPMLRRREALAQKLLEATGADALLARPAGHEKDEGIAPQEQPFARGQTPDEVSVREAHLDLLVQPHRGQKTGHYTDQRENRLYVGALAGGLDVLDLYAGSGGFSLQALRHDARHCLAVESSPRSAELANRNAANNDLAHRFEVAQDDARHVLGHLRSARREFGLVVVDPPNFFPRRGTRWAAAKAYRELNVRAMSRVAAGGFMATFVCSPRLDSDTFLEMLRSAGRECRRSFSVLRMLGAGPDHPVAPGVPESRYLSGFLLRIQG